MSGLEDIFGSFMGGGARGARTQNPFSSYGQSAQPQQFEMEVDFMTAANGGEVEIDIAGHRKRIKIPAGISEGQKIRITQPDTLIAIHIRPSQEFTREGHNIISKISVDPVTAMLGGTVTVPTIHGQSEVTIPKGTSSHAKLRLKGKGISGGDHFVEVKIETPKKISSKAKELLEKLKKEL